MQPGSPTLGEEREGPECCRSPVQEPQRNEVQVPAEGSSGRALCRATGFAFDLARDVAAGTFEC